MHIYSMTRCYSKDVMCLQTSDRHPLVTSTNRLRFQPNLQLLRHRKLYHCRVMPIYSHNQSLLINRRHSPHDQTARFAPRTSAWRPTAPLILEASATSLSSSRSSCLALHIGDRPLADQHTIQRLRTAPARARMCFLDFLVAPHYRTAKPHPAHNPDRRPTALSSQPLALGTGLDRRVVLIPDAAHKPVYAPLGRPATPARVRSAAPFQCVDAPGTQGADTL